MPKSALLIRMIDLLKTRPGITVRELAQHMDRSERTLYRWLSELAVDLQTPVYCRDGGYYLSEDRELKSIDLSPQELLALRLSLKSSPFGSGSPIKAHADSAWRKIRDAAAWESLTEANNLANSHAVDVTLPKGDVKTSVLETIEQAIKTHHRLHVLYRSQKSDTMKEYTVDPYAMVFRRHSWYLLAHSREHEKVIQMKLVRFQAARDTGIQFQPPDDFSIDDYFELSWEAWTGDPTFVRVKFSADVARMITETKRHPTQTTTWQADGTVVFEVEVLGIDEIAIWILGYGKDAEVIEPQSLRDMIADHVSGMASMYEVAQVTKGAI